MDGQRPNINGTKDVIPGVSGNNVFLPSLFTQPQIGGSTHGANQTNLPWKNQTFQNALNWVDQTKNLPMYNLPMFSGSMGANGTFDNTAWQNPSSSQSNMNLATNPLLAAFQQQSLGYMGNKSSNNTNSTAFNPLQPDPLNLHATTTSTLNPPITQPKQPPKTDTLFHSSLPSTSGTFNQHAMPATAHFPMAFGATTGATTTYDQLKEKINSLQPAQHMQQAFAAAQPQFPAAQPIARPVPRPAAVQPPPLHQQPLQQSFDLLSSMSNTMKQGQDKAGGGFNLSHIFQPQLPPLAPLPSLPSASLPSTTMGSFDVPSTSSISSIPQPLAQPSFPQAPSTSSLPVQQAPFPQVPSTSSLPIQQQHQPPPFLQVPSTSSSTNGPPPTVQIPPATIGVSKDDLVLISPRLKRRSGGQHGSNGELARPPSEGGLDLEGLDLFEGLCQNDKDAMLMNDFNFDDTMFNEPLTVAATFVDEPPPPPKPVEEPPPVVQPAKEAPIESAKSKMQRLMEQLKNKAPAAAAAAPARAAAATPSTPMSLTPTASVHSTTPAAPTVVAQKATTPATSSLEQSDKFTFTPPHSPSEASDLTKPSTSGISSLISASILPAELMGRLPEAKKKAVPVYGRPKASFTQPATIPVYKQSATDQCKPCFESKDDEFAFTDEDPEETGEKLEREEESDEEEKEKEKEKAQATNAAAGPSAPKYIPGIGFDVKEPEKIEDKTKKESKKPVPIYPGKKHVRQESIELAEKLRQRLRERINLDFSNVSQSEHNDCAIDSEQKNVEDADKPPLPRLLIRLPKKSIDGDSKESRRRRRKRHYYGDEQSEEDDDDWYGGKPKRGKRGRKPKRELNPDETYSVRLVDASTIEHARKEVPVKPVEYMSKKHKFLRNWKEDQASEHVNPSNSSRGVEGKIEPKSLTRIVSEYKSAEARERLEKFKPCSGNVHRGTFVVLKAEINNPDCALWRVDNMNLLQKFPGFTEGEGETERILYKNSSTYNGLCEQLQSGYMVVEVRHVRQTRSETIVEPEVPIVELFPAMADELNERYCVSSMRAVMTKEDATAQSEARTFILKDDLRNGLYMVLRNMLDGALNFDYFSQAEEAKVGTLDYPQYELLNEMECQVADCEEAIKERVSFLSKFDQSLARYASYHAVDCNLEELNCQACGEEPVQKNLQLFGQIIDEEKNGNSMDDDDFDEEEDEEMLPAVDNLICAECCKYAMWKHRLIHFRNDLVKRIEDRMLEATLEVPSLAPDQIVENLRQSYLWLKEIITAHTETWEKILQLDDEEHLEEAVPDAEVAAEVVDAAEPSEATVPAAVAAPDVPALEQAAVPGLDQTIASFLAAAAAAAQFASIPQPIEDDDSFAEIDPVTL